LQNTLTAYKKAVIWQTMRCIQRNNIQSTGGFGMGSFYVSEAAAFCFFGFYLSEEIICVIIISYQSAGVHATFKP
jgi:hypothetical protein